MCMVCRCIRIDGGELCWPVGHERWRVCDVPSVGERVGGIEQADAAFSAHRRWLDGVPGNVRTSGSSAVGGSELEDVRIRDAQCPWSEARGRQASGRKMGAYLLEPDMENGGSRLCGKDRKFRKLPGQFDLCRKPCGVINRSVVSRILRMDFCGRCHRLGGVDADRSAWSSHASSYVDLYLAPADLSREL